MKEHHKKFNSLNKLKPPKKKKRKTRTRSVNQRW